MSKRDKKVRATLEYTVAVPPNTHIISSSSKYGFSPKLKRIGQLSTETKRVILITEIYYLQKLKIYNCHSSELKSLLAVYKVTVLILKFTS